MWVTGWCWCGCGFNHRLSEPEVWYIWLCILISPVGWLQLVSCRLDLCTFDFVFITLRMDASPHEGIKESVLCWWETCSRSQLWCWVSWRLSKCCFDLLRFIFTVKASFCETWDLLNQILLLHPFWRLLSLSAFPLLFLLTLNTFSFGRMNSFRNWIDFSVKQRSDSCVLWL